MRAPTPFVAAVVLLACACGSPPSSEPPTSTAPPPPTATPPPTTTVAPALVPAPTLCLRAEQCCHGALGVLGVDAASQEAPCAPLAAQVADAAAAQYTCASQIDLWQHSLEALAHPPTAECVVRDEWRRAGPTWPLLSEAEANEAATALRDARAAAARHDYAAALAGLDALIAAGHALPPVVCEAGFIAHLAGDDAAATARIDQALAAFGSYGATYYYGDDWGHTSLAACEYNAGVVREALHRMPEAVAAYEASERLRDDPHAVARLVALGRPRPGHEITVSGVVVEGGEGSFTVGSIDPVVIERVLTDAFTRVDGGTDQLLASPRVTRGASIDLPAGGPYSRATAYAVIDTPVSPSANLLVLTGSAASRVVRLSSYTQCGVRRVDPLTLEIAGPSALRVSWTSECQVSASRNGAWEGHDGVLCTESWPLERRTFGWAGRCDLTLDARCTSAAITAREVVDTAPTFQCNDANGHDVPGRVPLPTDEPFDVERRPMTLELADDSDGGVELRDVGDVAAFHPPDLSALLHVSEGAVDDMLDAARRAQVSSRDRALVAAVAHACDDDLSRAVVIDFPGMTDFAMMSCDSGNGTERSPAWLGYLARTQAGWQPVSADTPSDEQLANAGTDEEGAAAGLPLAIDLTPGGSTELLWPERSSSDRFARDELVVCAARDTSPVCRRITLRSGTVSHLRPWLDAIRFDLAGHVFVTPHGAPEEQHDLLAWIAEAQQT